VVAACQQPIGRRRQSQNWIFRASQTLRVDPSRRRRPLPRRGATEGARVDMPPAAFCSSTLKKRGWAETLMSPFAACCSTLTQSRPSTATRYLRFGDCTAPIGLLSLYTTRVLQSDFSPSDPALQDA
jgi:hypothetical protein